MYYILTRNKKELRDITDALVKNGYEDSHIFPFDNAVGIATTPRLSRNNLDDKPSFTYLHPSVVSDNPHISWTFCRTECKTKKEFLDRTKK